MENEIAPEVKDGVKSDNSPKEFSPLHGGQLDEPVVPKWRMILIIISLSFGLFLSLLDTTIVATAIYTIGVDLDSLTSVNWVALSYTLSYLGCTVVFARTGDVVGRRNAYIAAFLIFLAFSLGCGFAQTLNQLIACRTLQGVGGSGLYSLTFVILVEVCPPKVVNLIGALAGAVVAMSGVLGPVLGGILTRYTTWRWIFWINAPIGIAPLVLFYIAWPKQHQLRPIQKRSWAELDFIGCVLIIAASVLVVFSLQEAGIKDNAWGTAIFLAPMIVGCIFWALLFVWEVLVARFWEESIATMFPLRLIKRRVYMVYVFCTLLMGFPYFLVIYALPLRFQVVNGKSPLVAGISLLPMLGSSAIASVIGSAMNSKRNNTCLTLLTGSCLMVIGTALFSTLSNTVEVQARTYGFQVFVGLGFGLTVSTVSLGATLETPVRDNTVAQGIIAQFRVLGGSIGIAASTAILGVIQRNQLAGIITPAQLATLESSAKSFTPAQLYAVRQAYSDAFREDLRVCAIISGICILLTLGAFRRNPEPVLETRKRLMTEEQTRLRALKVAKASA